MEDIRQIGRGDVVDGLEDGGDVMERGSSGDDTGSRILDMLELVEGFVRENKES